MLVSFHESYLLLVELCALFCVLTMAYNLYDHMTAPLRRRKQNRRVEALREQLDAYAWGEEEGQKKSLKKISKILNHSNGILALSAALNEIGWDESAGMDPLTRRTLCELLTEKYIKIYRKEDESVQGMLISLLTRCDASSSRLKWIMLENLKAKNLLVRIETLRFISSQRNRKLMILALEAIQGQPQYFSNKLLTDTLLEFQGDKKMLLEEIWENQVAYSQNIKVAILQTITVMKEESFAERIYEIVEDQEADKELRIAGLKYFQSVSRPEYVKTFAEFLTNPTWEYGAVAANVLRNYDCTEVFDQLLEGSASRNWYVRNNCAKTIVACCKWEQIRRAMRSEDRYSRDSIQYAWDTVEKERSMA